MANSQEEFGATLAVIRDAGVSSALVFWNHRWGHLSVPGRFWGGGCSATTWLVSQDVEWAVVFWSFCNLTCHRQHLPRQHCAGASENQSLLYLTTPKARTVKSLSVFGNLCLIVLKNRPSAGKCLGLFLPPWKDRKKHSVVSEGPSAFRDVQWAPVPINPWASESTDSLWWGHGLSCSGVLFPCSFLCGNTVWIPYLPCAGQRHPFPASASLGTSGMVLASKWRSD